MRTFKSIFVLLLALTISFGTINASTLPSPEKTMETELAELVKTIDFYDVDEDQTIMVDFIVSNDNQILVLSTSETDFDMAIKAKLNYHVLQSDDVLHYKKYTLPITLKK